MKKQGKILLTDIKAERNTKESLKEYLSILATSFNKYATIKMSLNYFTMVEMTEGMKEERAEEIKSYFERLDKAVKETVLSDKEVSCDDINDIVSIRDSITKKMKILTAYTDALELYEYILNRREAFAKGQEEEYIDTDALAYDLFEYVFSDKDKMVINSKLQGIIAQLPVRMTKNRFYDIISNTIEIYKGGEKDAVNDFVEMIENSCLINIPDGFVTEYRDLYDIYMTLKSADYKNITVEEYAKLSGLIDDASEKIGEAVTDYMMMQEIINDALVILFTGNMIEKKYLDDKYQAAKEILNGVMGSKDIYADSEKFDGYFVSLEGAQEDSYEELAWLDGNLLNLQNTYADKYDDLKDMFNKLGKADKLTSSSFFMDINKDIAVLNDAADEEFLNSKKEKLINDFKGLFETVSKFEQRAIISKTLSVMPVFFNSQDEIKTYFEYTLSRCGDDSELTACKNIFEDMMSE